VVGRLVRSSEERGVPLSNFSADDFREAHEAFEPDVLDVFDWEASVDARAAAGGTALDSVDAQLTEASSRMAAARSALAG
jgi:argininosuccinate lyase